MIYQEDNMKGILGRKVAMTQIFTNDGTLIPVTAVEVLPNTVLQVKTQEKNGYTALQLGVQDKRANLVNKAEAGQFKQANSTPKRFVKEIRGMEGFNQGDVIKVEDLFQAGEIIDVTGTSKGKGFAGSVKKNNNRIGPKAHGSGYHRGVGSMGAIINRVFKGRKMPGHMGHEQVTIQNLLIVNVDADQNLVYIKGSIPGPKNSFLVLKANAKQQPNTTVAELLNRAPMAPEVETVAVEAESN